ncbi:MAG: 3-dehydroquinate synthase [Nitrospira sp.]|nr:3-dehydroquinate synthase [Nitrospira sp.]
MLINVVLTGFMGTGKTVVGKSLAQELDYEFVDTDCLIEQEAGQSISQIFRRSGEAYFRRVEKDVIRKLSGREGLVMATGGGAILDPENMASLSRQGLLVCLNAHPRTIVARLKGQKDRPLLDPSDRFNKIQRLLKHRLPFYNQADYIIQTDRMSVPQIVRKLQEWFFMQLSHRVKVTLPQDPYEIQVGWRILDRLGEQLKHLGLGQKVGVVTNPVVRKLYGSLVLKSLKKTSFRTSLIEIPDGERFKTTRWANVIYDELIRNKFERQSCLVALGGGVIGDMTGFAAATYLRGIPYVQVPTTLAAQVDASIGGKTGVNHPLGKNLIGAFHQPRLVYADVKVLESLDRRSFISGLAEVVKYGVIADAEFFNFLERHLSQIIGQNPCYLLPAIRRSCEIKAQVVQEDEREGGLRKILNYGHTLGHALEAVTSYRRYLHGEAISIGMVFAARLAYDLGLCDKVTVQRQEALLAKIGLPISLPKDSPSSILEAMSHDKKVKQGEIHFVLADKIGHVLIRKVKASQIRRLL